MQARFVQKLSRFSALSPEDIGLLTAATSRSRTYPARHDLIREGDRPGPMFVVLEGWACRYKILPEGSRQITALMMPGDSCDLNISILAEMDHNIGTITPARVATVAREHMAELIDTRPAITRALWTAQLVDEGILRAWIVSMGRRSSVARVSHLMCELYLRAHAVGLAGDDKMVMPLTQIVLADALGLTPVHVNRVLRTLRSAGALETMRGKVVFSNPVKLAQIAGFDENYLHRRLRLAA